MKTGFSEAGRLASSYGLVVAKKAKQIAAEHTARVTGDVPCSRYFDFLLNPSRFGTCYGLIRA